MTLSGDTIFAVASGPGRGGVAVLRLSGPKAGPALAALCGHDLPPPRYATRVQVGFAGETIDDGLALWFPAPRSFTGEDVAELHLHGGRAVLAAVSDALVTLGLRPAEPGEFTRRAFTNGKMDLTAAEGIADLVAAETAAQRRQALRQMDGALARLYDGWRERLIRAQAHLEADIDFSDEDLPDALNAQARAALAGLRTEIAGHLVQGAKAARLRDGVEVAIVGAPNVGKSSLLNRLSRREAAIVSHIAGTTRDVVEVHLDLGGIAVVLADTAGLREAGDVIEEIGITRARARAERADLTIAVFDAEALPEWDPATTALLDERSLVVINKLDRRAVNLPAVLSGVPVLGVAAATGQGLDTLEAELTRRVADLAGEGADPAPTRARHVAALTEAVDALARAAAAGLPELAAEDVRLAARAIGRITGRVDVEDLLDVIFRDFCIGK